MDGDDTIPSGAYGVFSVPSEAEPQETLYNVLDDEFQAVVWMGRFIVFRAFHLIPYEQFHKLVNALSRSVEAKRYDQVFRCASKDYYVRELTVSELRDIALENPLVEPPAA